VGLLLGCLVWPGHAVGAKQYPMLVWCSCWWCVMMFNTLGQGAASKGYRGCRGSVSQLDGPCPTRPIRSPGDACIAVCQLLARIPPAEPTVVLSDRLTEIELNPGFECVAGAALMCAADCRAGGSSFVRGLGKASPLTPSKWPAWPRSVTCTAVGTPPAAHQHLHPHLRACCSCWVRRPAACLV
jgi:hypothetical protein